MLLWSKPGKEYKYWTRAFQRFIKNDLQTGQQLAERKQEIESESPKTVYLTQKPENAFVLSVFQSLIPRLEPDYSFVEQEEVKTVEGWLCKTADSLPKSPDEETFVKVYSVFDFAKRQLLLCDKTNGYVVEKFIIDSQLRYIDSNLHLDMLEHRKIRNSEASLTNQLIPKVQHLSADSQILEQITMPQTFCHPFALIFTDGALQVFWAESLEEVNKWKYVFQKLVPDRLNLPDGSVFVNYVLRSKQNTLKTALYAALHHKITNGNQIVEPNEELKEGEKSEDDGVVSEEHCEKVATFVLELEEEKVAACDAIEGEFLVCRQQVQADEVFERRKLNFSTAKKQLQVFTIDSDEDVAERQQPVAQIDLLNDKAVIEVLTDFKTRLDTTQVDEIDDAMMPNLGQDQMPSEDLAPFGVFLADGTLLMLWATDLQDKNNFISAFNSLKVEKSEPFQTPWVKIDSENALKLHVYRSLVTACEIDHSKIKLTESIESEVRLTLPKPAEDCAEKFPISAMKLDNQKGSLEVSNQFYKRVFTLPGQLCQVDTALKNQLVPDYRDYFMELYLDSEGRLKLPDDEYRIPFALNFINGDSLLIWLASRQSVEHWRQALEAYLPTDQKFNFLLIGPRNEFASLVYKSLKRTSLPPNELLQLPETLEINSQAAQEIKVNQSTSAEIITGWLSRTEGGYPAQGKEAFVYKFFKLNMQTAVLTEHEDQLKSRRLNEFILFRKIIFVETGLSNELHSESDSVFMQHCNKLPPAGFSMPLANVKPICLHLEGSELLLLWASAKREYTKWLEAFSRISLPVNQTLSRQRLLVKVTQKNCFSVSIFMSMRPAKPNWNQPNQQTVALQAEVRGRCMKTAQSTSSLKSDYFLARFYALDSFKKKLTVFKAERGESEKVHDLRTLCWIEAGLTIEIQEGFRSVLKRNGINLSHTAGKLTQVGEFKFPIVLGMRDGSIAMLWFSEEEEHEKLHEIFSRIIESNPETALQTQQYIVQTKMNNFVASMCQILKPRSQKNPSIVKGTLSVAYDKEELIFVDKYVILNTSTGVLSVYPRAYCDVEEELDLRFGVAINNLDQECKQLQVSPTILVKLTLQNKVFALHNASHCLVFLANDPKEFKKWSTAFARINLEEFRDSEFWIDSSRKENIVPEIIHNLSFTKPNLTKVIIEPGIADTNPTPEGFLCKTAQSLDKHLSRGKIFYKRYYEIDSVNRELHVRNSANSKIKETFPLDKLIKVDDTLRQTLCARYRLYFREHTSSTSKITTPRDFSHPFCLLFQQGVVQLLWATTEQERDQWTRALRQYEPEQRLEQQVLMRHPENFFVSTMYLCLKPETPPILLQTKFVASQDEAGEKQKKTPDAETVSQRETELQKQKELEEAMVSAQGWIEGWLYKTSQKIGFFQNEFFHKRYYKLDLRNRQLEISGRTSHTIDLKRQVMKVEGDLKRSFSQSDVLSLGRPVRTPEFPYPFAVFTTSEISILWAETEAKRTQWVNAFRDLLLSSDQADVASFKTRHDKSNKFVYDVYQCLSGPQNSLPDDKTKAKNRTQTIQADLGSKPQDSENPSDDVPKPAQDHLPEQNIAQTNLNQILITSRKEKADLQKHLNDLAKDDEDDCDAPASASAMKQHLLQVNRLPSGRGRQISCSGQKENKRSRSLAGAEVTILRNQTKTQLNKSGGSITQAIANINQRRQSVNQQTKSLKQNDQQEEDAGKICPTMEKNTSQGSLLQETDANLSSLQNDTGVSADKRPGRRLKQPSCGSSRGPIKIKRMIPLKDTTQIDVNRQSLQSIFTGQSEHNNDNNIVAEDDKNLKQDSLNDEKNDEDDDDDNIEREDPAWQAVQAPSFRRRMQASNQSQKLKIKLKRRSQASSKSPYDERTDQQTQYAQQTTFRNPPYANESYFEDKVSHQVDKNFVKNLLSRSTNRRSYGSKSAWGEIAQSLRDKIKVTTARQAQQNSMSCFAQPMLSGRETHRSSVALPIKSAGPVKILSQAITSDEVCNQDLNKKPPYPRSAAVTRYEAKGSQQIDDQTHQQNEQLSDWDANSNSGEEEKLSSDVVLSQNVRKRNNNTSGLVNVRDHTSGLANVFNSLMLPSSGYGKKAAAQQCKELPRAQPNQYFQSSYRRDAGRQLDLAAVKVSLEADPDIEEYVEDNEALDGTGSEDAAQKQDSDLPMNNADDCFAESYNSVWE